MSHAAALNLSSTHLRLRSDLTTEALTVDDSFWPRLGSGQLGDFRNECLVASFSFDADWSSWEMHPAGDEIVCLLSGRATFVLERAQGQDTVELRAPGDFLVVPKGIWHTARTDEPCTMLFITPGENTQHRAAGE